MYYVQFVKGYSYNQLVIVVFEMKKRFGRVCKYCVAIGVCITSLCLKCIG